MLETIPTRLDGPLLIAPAVHTDARGFTQETFRRDSYGSIGITEEFVQDNHSRSRRGVIRGMHFQLPPGQAKLVRCGYGAIWDVVVDIRAGSPTFGEWEGHDLTDENHHQLYVPVGFAHGFCVTSEVADVLYKLSNYYDPALERGFAFDDPEVGILWPPKLDFDASARDRTAPRLSQLGEAG